jgi:hypothetical protein
MRSRLTNIVKGFCALLALATLAAITSDAQATLTYKPIALVSGVVPMPSSQDPMTGWMIHNRANVSLQVVKTSIGSYVVKLSYSDTQGLTFSGNWLRNVQVIPIYTGSTIASKINVTLGVLCKTLYDVATLNITNAGKDANGNVLYNVNLQVWDGFHKNQWVNVNGQFAPEVTDVIMSPKYH